MFFFPRQILPGLDCHRQLEKETRTVTVLSDVVSDVYIIIITIRITTITIMFLNI